MKNRKSGLLGSRPAARDDREPEAFDAQPRFVPTQVQQSAVGATAIGAAAMGMGAASIGLVNMAMNSDEEAEWVEFELDGNRVQGWMWLMPMRNGDTVEV